MASQVASKVALESAVKSLNDRVIMLKVAARKAATDVVVCRMTDKDNATRLESLKRVERVAKGDLRVAVEELSLLRGALASA